MQSSVQLLRNKRKTYFISIVVLKLLTIYQTNLLETVIIVTLSHIQTQRYNYNYLSYSVIIRIDILFVWR